MSKPVIEGDKIIVTREWFNQAIIAVDRNSYACGGILACSNAEEAMAKLIATLLTSDIAKLKTIAR